MSVKPFPALELITGLPKTVSEEERAAARAEYFVACSLLKACKEAENWIKDAIERAEASNG